MRPILVTGAGGFLGRAVGEELAQRGLPWRAAVRTLRPEPGGAVAPDAGRIAVGEVGPDTDWSAALAGVGAVIHLAAAAHERAARDENALRAIHVAGTAALARQARLAGVGRIVLASSVKAMGEASPSGRPWTEDDPCRPASAYGRCKLGAEDALRTEAGGGVEAVVLRLPLVYGPGVRANLERLMRAVLSRRPLPFGALRNRRSLIGRANAADALVTGALAPRAAGGAFLVRDGDWSTPELVREIAAALGVTPRLVAAPAPLLRAAAWLLPGLGRLVHSLAVDDARIRRELGWAPRRAPREEWRLAAAALAPDAPAR